MLEYRWESDVRKRKETWQLSEKPNFHFVLHACFSWLQDLLIGIVSGIASFLFKETDKKKKKQSKRKSMLFGGHWHSFSTMSGTHQSLALTERVKVRHFLQCPRGWHCIKERERNSICIINYMKHTRLFAFSFFCWKKRLQKIIIYRDSLILGLI